MEWTAFVEVFINIFFRSLDLFLSHNKISYNFQNIEFLASRHLLQLKMQKCVQYKFLRRRKVIGLSKKKERKGEEWEIISILRILI